MKNEESKPEILRMLNGYKDFIRETKNEGEVYKWASFEHFHRHWDVEAPEFEKMFNQAFKKKENLFYQNSWGYISKLTKHFPEEAREMFKMLFNENLDLKERITGFQEKAMELLPRVKEATSKPKLNHQQDERTISVYLSHRFPEKYLLFKDGYYQDFCNMMGETASSTGEKYLHYLDLAERFKNEFVIPDTELAELHESIRPEVSWDDTNLIVQNILFVNTYPKAGDIKVIIVNITWNSEGWTKPTREKSTHKYVAEGGIPAESWNFDFENPRNTEEIVYGFSQFTNPPKVSGDNNLIIFSSMNKIVGFYGKAEVLARPYDETLEVEENYNLAGKKELSLCLENKIDNLKEKGYLEDNKRIGQIGFSYLKNPSTIIKMLNEAIELNPDQEEKLLRIKDWIVTQMKGADELNYWVFQANPTIYNVVEALKDGALKSWSVSAHKKEIKIGDKVILWKVGEKPGCYALCRVVSEVINREDDEIEQKYYTDLSKPEAIDRVRIEIEVNLWDRPVLKEQVLGLPEFRNFKAGRQGTNFSASKEEYLKILEMAKIMGNRRYWLYSPGRGAKYWEEFFNAGIMAIGWEKLGDLNQYQTREEIYLKLQEIEETDSSKKNDTSANFDFKEVMKVGDIVIAKKGKKEYIGYGFVASDYYYDSARDYYKKCRKVNWVKKGTWIAEDGEIVLKTLTDITSYQNYPIYLMKLLGIELPVTGQRKFDCTLPLNTILYGPPGTGKTFSTIDLALQIVDPLFYDKNQENRQVLRERFNELLISNWEKEQEGQIAFITFHQSLSYEDFVEGIKPFIPDADEEEVEGADKLSYTIQGGIFKKLCRRAESSPAHILDFDNLWDQYTKSIFSNNDETVFQSTYSELKLEKEKSNPQSFKLRYKKSWKEGEAEGTTMFFVGKETIRKVFDARINLSDPNLKKWVAVRNLVGSYRATTVYAVYNSFFSFSNLGQLFQETSSNLPYVLIIDEINRGNVSQIFGELITLIEKDKRKGMSEGLEVTLPYSKESFSVPSNLFIIGTMNTADRSVEALDTALRRRFSFSELMPKPNLIRTCGAAKDSGGVVENIDLVLLLETINQRLVYLLDEDHQIGHSFFLGIKNKKDLRSIFRDNIVPLLKEFFYNDFGKIRLVLGDGFVEKTNASSSKPKFATDEDEEFVLDKTVYKLKEIGEEFDIINALKKAL